MRQLIGAALALGTGRFDKIEIVGIEAVKNALLESFTIHARNVLKFLYDSEKTAKPDDVLASHFVVSSVNPSTWEQQRPGLVTVLEEVNSRVNKEIVHLTYARLKRRKNKEWRFLELAKEIDSVFKVGTVQQAPTVKINPMHEVAYRHASDGLDLALALPSP
jgi:hypothetical protein